MPEKAYKNLLERLKKKLDMVERLVSDNTDRLATLENIWSMGEDIHIFVNESGMPISEIALDIGAAPGSLQKYVRFYKCWPKGYQSEFDGKPVEWSHYAALLYINDPKMRDFYIKEAALQGWSTQELRRRIRNNYYEARQEFSDAKSHSQARLPAKNQKLYTYSAEVLKVVDGDTLELNIDVGFNTRMKHKARLRGIDCPELKTKKGEEAKAFVEKELIGLIGDVVTGGLVTQNFPIIIRTYKTEKFGRYLVDLWYLPGEKNKEVILEKGLLLNQVLLDKGLARKVE